MQRHLPFIHCIAIIVIMAKLSHVDSAYIGKTLFLIKKDTIRTSFIKLCKNMMQILNQRLIPARKKRSRCHRLMMSLKK